MSQLLSGSAVASTDWLGLFCSLQVLLYGLPLVSEWFEILLQYGGMKGVPLLRADALVLREVRL